MAVYTKTVVAPRLRCDGGVTTSMVDFIWQRHAYDQHCTLTIDVPWLRNVGDRLGICEKGIGVHQNQHGHHSLWMFIFVHLYWFFFKLTSRFFVHSRSRIDLESHKRYKNNEPNWCLDRLSVRTACTSF